MRNSVGDEVLGAANEIMEAVRLVLKLAVIVPCDTSITTATHLRLSNDPTALHRGHLYQVKVLRHRNTVAAIALHEYTISPVHFNSALLKEEVHWDLLAIMGRHKQLLTFEVLAVDRGLT